ncbi:hypothetical protein [Nocardioides sp.]|uniref:hypothetical protein n=1 Tax=Nocardioides sp. TaxID=35761 RepID=UPI002F3EFFB3
MLRRLGASSLALAGAVTLLAGCGAGGSSSAAPPDATAPPSSSDVGRSAPFDPTRQDFRAIRRVMAAQAKAVVAGDEKGFVATVDPQQPDLVARQRVLFDNLRQLDVTHLAYAVDTSALVPARVPGGDPVFHPVVVEHLQLAQTLSEPVSNPVDMTFVRRHGHWLVGAVSQPEDSGHFDSPQERPWYGVPVVARRDGALTVIVDASAADSLDRLTTAIRDDITYDAHLLGVPASYRVLVDATTNGLAYDFSSVSREEAAAVTFGLTASDRLGNHVTGPAGTAIKVNPNLVDDVVSDTGILRHELTHYLLREYSGSNPKRLTEGVATWVEYYPDDFSALQVPATLYRSVMHADRALPSIGLFNTDPTVNYPVSQAAVAWLVDHGGVAKLIELMKAYRAQYQDVNADALTPRLFRQVYGVNEADVVQGAFAKLAELQH